MAASVPAGVAAAALEVAEVAASFLYGDGVDGGQHPGAREDLRQHAAGGRRHVDDH